jgi:hypothetical protein
MPDGVFDTMGSSALLSRGAFSAETMGRMVSKTKWPVWKHLGEIAQGLI